MVQPMKQKYFNEYYKKNSSTSASQPVSSYMLNYLMGKLIKSKDYYNSAYRYIVNGFRMFDKNYESEGGGYKLWKKVIFIHGQGFFLSIKSIPQSLQEVFKLALLSQSQRYVIVRHPMFYHKVLSTPIISTGNITKLPIGNTYIKLNCASNLSTYINPYILIDRHISDIPDIPSRIAGYSVTRLISNVFWERYYPTKYKEKYPQRHICTIQPDEYTEFKMGVVKNNNDAVLAVINELESILFDLKIKPIFTIGELKVYRLDNSIPSTEYNTAMFNNIIFSPENIIYLIV